MTMPRSDHALQLSKIAVVMLFCSTLSVIAIRSFWYAMNYYKMLSKGVMVKHNKNLKNFNISKIVVKCGQNHSKIGTGVNASRECQNTPPKEG